MYHPNFIFHECGFDWLPAHIDRTLLYNVSYDPITGDVKLYVLDRSREFLHKITRDGSITRQDKVRPGGAEAAKLSACLGGPFDFDQLLLDTVEGAPAAY